tara:strand:+ start:350 stop:1225 length:876 start_codon:yes stop_codon:yes gene_type:complete
MSIVTVNLIDTFDEWRIKTNLIGSNTGSLTSLNTTNKNSLVESLNEIFLLSQTNLDNIVEDTSPELGGDLNLNNHEILGTGNINITGSLTATSIAGTVTGVTQSTGDVSTKLATTQFVTNTTNLIPIGGDLTGTTGNAEIANGVVGIPELDVSDGIAGQLLKTDGAGTLSFISPDLTIGGDLSGTISNAQIVANTIGINELDTSDGTSGQVLQTDGSGVMSFQNIFTEITILNPTANQTLFTISYQVNRISVFLNGVKLVLGMDFTASNGTSVTLSLGVGTTDVIEFHLFN